MPKINVISGRWQELQSACQAIRSRAHRPGWELQADTIQDNLDPLSIHYLALLDKKPIASVRLSPQGDIGYLAVLPPYQRRGIGTALLDYLIDRARLNERPCLRTEAPASLVPFFTRFGFHSDNGAALTETAHPTLRLDLSPQTMPLPDNVEGFAAAMASGGDYFLDTAQSLQQAVIALAQGAQYKLFLAAPQFDNMLFGQNDFLTALTALIRRHPHTQIRLLLNRPKSLVQSASRLLQLHRRMPSRLEIREAHPAYRPQRDSYLIVDQRHILHLPNPTQAKGYCELLHSKLARLKSEEFQLFWSKSRTVKELQATSL